MTIKRVITLTAPTCSGKTTVERLLTALHGFGRFISHTTRQPRPGEVNDVDYHFVDHEFFDKEADSFLENILYEGNCYGIHSSELARLDALGVSNVILVAEPIGVGQVRKWCHANDINVVSLFLEVPAATCYLRFLKRVLGDEAVNNNLIIYAKRAATLVDELQWRHNATSEMTIIDADESTPEQVVAKILNVINTTTRES